MKRNNPPVIQKPKRIFKGIWIPAKIWLNTDLSLIEKCFLIEIDSLDGENGCFASNRYFADFFNVSLSRCSQIINGLERKGYVKIKLEREGKQIKRRVIRVFNLLKGGIKNIKGGYLENYKDNNTYINNTYIKLHSSGSKTTEDKKPSSKKKPDPNLKEYKKLSKLLKKIIQSHKNYNVDMSSCSNSFRLLITKDLKINGTPFQDIKKRVIKVLKFYEKNIGGDFIPVALSGPSFREKFIRLEEAMERVNTSKKKTTSDEDFWNNRQNDEEYYYNSQ